MAFDRVTLQQACEAAGSVLGGLDQEMFANPTPCAEWLVEDLVMHLVNATEFFADVLEYGESKSTLWDDCNASTVVLAFRDHADHLISACSVAGAMERRVLLPTGEETGTICLQVATGELFVHSWDLARATNQPLSNTFIADTLLTSDWMKMCEQVRRSEGVFAPAVEKDVEWSATDRLVAFLGRDPHWDGK